MRKRICALVLCLCMLLALPVFIGAGTQPQEDSGLVLSKSSEYDAETGAVRITLEAYAKGQIIAQRVSTPCDIALVLDESGSMAYPIGTTPVYQAELETDETYYYVVDSNQYAVTYQNGSWGYTNKSTRYSVQATTGPDDTDSSQIGRAHV